MSAEARLAAHYALGIAILNDLTTGPGAIGQEREWTAKLPEVGKPFGAVFVGRLHPYIGEIEPGELRLLDGTAAPAADNHFWSLVVLAVRLHRIQTKMKQLDAVAAVVPAAPVAKPGRPARGAALRERASQWEDEIRARARGLPRRDAARRIAEREKIDLGTIEREARRIKKERGEKISRRNFPRR